MPDIHISPGIEEHRPLSRTPGLSFALRLLCAFILCAILTAGLWPFHAPKNNVTWLAGQDGLLFGRYGTVVGSGDLSLTDLKNPGSYSVEIWLEPASSKGANTILAIYSPQNPLEFSLRQSNSDLAIESQLPGRPRHRRVYVDDVFEQGRPVFLTIAAGASGMRVYLNGILARMFSGFRLAGNALAGRVVIGTSPVQESCWPGRLRGLALYRTELTPERALDHYRSWTRSKRPFLHSEDQVAALYLLNEHSGNVVFNQTGRGNDLSIPQRFTLIHEKFLDPPWNEYYPGLSYWYDVAINIGGFVPLGFVFCASFAVSCSMGRAAFGAVLVGVGTTLTIELLQSYLPTRQSGVTDLCTNTLGACFGVLLYCWLPLRNFLAETLFRLSFRADA